MCDRYSCLVLFFCFFNDTATTEIYTLSLHDALPIWIDRIKRALLEIGPMRPGSLTRQYKDPPHQAGAYWQISYTRRMKSRTEYVRREWVKEIRRQTATHKRFKRLVDQWIDLSIEHSRLTMQFADPRESR